MPASLLSRDVARLMSEPSPEVRGDLAGKLGADLTRHTLTEGEVKEELGIVRILARDVAELRLAYDVESVALPMLADSLVLSDADLIEIVRQGSMLKQEAVAGRPALTESVSDALITHGAGSAVTVLINNSGAVIAEDGFNHAMTRFADSEQVKEAMVLRETLPAAIAERLISMVSKELRTYLVKARDLLPKTAADIVSASQEHAIIHLSLGASDQDLRQMVMQIHSNGRLTPSLILRALCSGDIALFEAAMAARSDPPLENAQILIPEPGRQGLAALYRGAAMPEELFGVVLAAVEIIDDIRFDRQPRDLKRLRL